MQTYSLREVCIRQGHSLEALFSLCISCQENTALLLLEYDGEKDRTSGLQRVNIPALKQKYSNLPNGLQT